MNTSISQSEEALLNSPMKKKNLSGASIEGSPTKATLQKLDEVNPLSICSKCDQLQNQLKLFGEEIVKLNQLEKNIEGKYRQRYDDNKAHANKLDQHVSFDIQEERVIIKQLQQKMRSICENNQREIEILSKLLQRPIIEIPRQKLKEESTQPNQNSGCIEKQNVKAEEIQAGIQQILSNSVETLEKEKSSLSGSLTSEHKSMIQRMTPEEREAYYSKNMKNRKIMAKLKRKK